MLLAQRMTFFVVVASIEQNWTCLPFSETHTHTRLRTLKHGMLVLWLWLLEFHHIKCMLHNEKIHSLPFCYGQTPIDH